MHEMKNYEHEGLLFMYNINQYGDETIVKIECVHLRSLKTDLVRKLN